MRIPVSADKSFASEGRSFFSKRLEVWKVRTHYAVHRIFLSPPSTFNASLKHVQLSGNDFEDRDDRALACLPRGSI